MRTELLALLVVPGVIVIVIVVIVTFRAACLAKREFGAFLGWSPEADSQNP